MSTTALTTMVVESVRFASWAVGEGLCPADGEPASDPADFLMAYSKATDFEDWEHLAEHVTARIAEQDAKIAQMREALELGIALVSNDNGWGTWQKMEGVEIYAEASRFEEAAIAAYLAATGVATAPASETAHRHDDGIPSFMRDDDWFEDSDMGARG